MDANQEIAELPLQEAEQIPAAPLPLRQVYWQSRYGPLARRRIDTEFVLLLLLILFAGIVLIDYWVWFNKSPSGADVSGKIFGLWQLSLSHRALVAMAPYFFGGFAGLIGGTIHSVRWLVKSISEGTWNEDYVYWRVSSPFFSFCMALVFVAAIDAQAISGHLQRPSQALALGFFVGLFGDDALKALRRAANALFGNELQKE